TLSLHDALPISGFKAKFAHHLRGRALDGLPADDWRYRDDRCATRLDRIAHDRYRQDRLDADERIGRTYDHGPHVPRAQRRRDVGVWHGECHAVERQLMDN